MERAPGMYKHENSTKHPHNTFIIHVKPVEETEDSQKSTNNSEKIIQISWK